MFMTNYTQHRITMVDTQVRPQDVTKFPIIDAMLSIPKEAYVPDTLRDLAYIGGPLDLGDGRQVLDPRGMAKLIDVLDITPSSVVLTLGDGTGYAAAVLAHMAQAVVAVEEDEFLAREAEATLNTQQIDNAVVIHGHMAEGSIKHGPYDAIAIFGGIETLPKSLADQVKENGRIAAVFMDGPLGEARVGLKTGGQLSWRAAFNTAATLLPGFTKSPSFIF